MHEQRASGGIVATAAVCALAFGVWLGAVPARAAEPVVAAPAAVVPVAAPAEAPDVAPVLTPAPLFMTDYLCTCEVYDPCTFTFTMGGRFCPVGAGCTCHPQVGRNGCVTGIASIDCDDNSS